MLNTTITWGDLFKVALFILATGVLFYLLLAVANLVDILRNVRRILDRNRASIDNTLERLPEITENVAKVSDMLKEEMESVQKVVKNVGKISDSAKDAVEVLKNDVLVKAKGLLEVMDWIRKIFEKDDRKKEIVYRYKYRPREEEVKETVRGKDSEQRDCNDDKKQDFIKEDGNNNKCDVDEGA
ncbi:hypothetical protein CSTERTH_12875 [Thermoclostridium stercorarium subsp. thermolacticum DSM 2910]|uniref:DUF948 domain-containing protein n=1 Tax=Thermoclostridium stercorarium subsp. thermolacticum DSM 2910 TaxID=1121336 RepID=A0A1B1YGJ7_THEST|nr:hypothetical protein [Thermoclostridium stercorarium]ANW99860.1 hypothetical protein CSTERTH_12875 [Thermoclostridium stercorarium subsp. thermolacticum DSM 2910]